MRAATRNRPSTYPEPRTSNVEPRTSNLEPRTPNPEPSISARPLLKWAGGKRQLLRFIRPVYPAQFDRYIEPFFGSGAVFFDLNARGLLDHRQAVLVDANPDLVGCYRMLRDRPDEVIAELQLLAAGHERGGDAFFYDVRDRRFNPLRASMRGEYSPELAAMLVYLNRTGFNGLFRLNRRGEFNVPAGRYVNPNICDAPHLRSVADAFRRPGVTMRLGSFEEAIAVAGRGDFLYCDPPYEPLSETANFASYTAEGFAAADQARLQREVIGAARRGAHIILSNSSAPLILSLYTSRDARAAGLVLQRVPARRAINSRAALRGPVDEVIVTNAAAAALLGVRVKMVKAAL
jgi:DNA adenine methylase